MKTIPALIMCITDGCISSEYCLRKTQTHKRQHESGRKDFGYFAVQWEYDQCIHFVPNEKYKTFEILKA